METINIVEATIDELQSALSSGALTSVDLVSHYIRRISKYDARGIPLNSIPILNDNVFKEAAASDDYRASGKPVRRLEGIPFTVKDSFKVKGMTVAAGSPAFKDLVATDDAFTVSAIKAEGGILIGRTNMPPMAYGGMQRGIYGRSESPYNPEYLAAAFASGSSNGSAVSTAASFAAFGMGEETVSSGRSPASNNAVVAYTPSRGWISIRGNWPLYPTCDVVVPHTRTMKDMLALLEVISAEDSSTLGDFWRSQPFVELSKPWGGSRVPGEFLKIASCTSLQGVRLAVPSIYVGGACPPGATPVTVDPGVIRAWDEARRQLEKLGAEVVIVPDFPVVTAYENPELLSRESRRLPSNWHWTERGPLVAHGWDLFLRTNGDPNIPNLAAVDEFNIYPDSMRTPAEMENFPMQNAIHWGKLGSYLQSSTMFGIQNLEAATTSLEGMREQLLDDYLKQFNCHCFVFPAAGDVGAADADVDSASAAHAWKNGVFYSNGNRALRHLGVPSVTVPMGMIADKKMPVGLTFAGRAYDDVNLLKWANAFETSTKMRTPPRQTPALPTDSLTLDNHAMPRAGRPLLNIDWCTSSPAQNSDFLEIAIRGSVAANANFAEDSRLPAFFIQIIINGDDIPQDQINIQPGEIVDSASTSVYFESRVTISKPIEMRKGDPLMEPVACNKTIVTVLARVTSTGYPAGFLSLI